MQSEKKSYLDVVAVIAASLAAIASGVAIVISVRSCNIADDALETAKTHFLQINRPFITLKPKKFKKIDSFLKISRKSDVILEVIVQMEMKNSGNVAAKDITTPKKLALKKRHHEEPFSVSYVMPPKISLGPAESYPLIMGANVGYKDNQAAQKAIDKFNSDAFEGLEIHIPVHYRSGIDPSKRYMTLKAFKFKKHSAQLLKSETTTTQESNG